MEDKIKGESLFQIRQQPLRGRISGFANLPDRRMLDPPLILQLMLPEESDIEAMASRFVCHVTIYTTNDENASFIGSGRTVNGVFNCHQTLLGQTCTSGAMLKDIDSENAIFFVFPDLSVRIQGEYSLWCRLFDLSLQHENSCLKTEKFTVYPPKNFPGMLESTTLSKHLAAQGIAMRSRHTRSSRSAVTGTDHV